MPRAAVIEPEPLPDYAQPPAAVPEDPWARRALQALAGREVLGWWWEGERFVVQVVPLDPACPYAVRVSHVPVERDPVGELVAAWMARQGYLDNSAA